METLTLVVGSERVNIVSYRLENVFMGMQGPAGPAVQFGTADQQVLFDDAGVVRGDTGLLFNKTTKTITIGGATVTVSAPVVNATQTWNAAGVTFTGLRLNVTDTASAAGSLLADLQVGGASKFSVRKDGMLAWGHSAGSPALKPVGAVLQARLGDDSAFATVYALSFSPIGGTTTLDNSGLSVNNGTHLLAITGDATLAGGSLYSRAATGDLSFFGPAFIGWASGAGAVGLGNQAVTRLYRDADHVIAQRNGASAQTFNIYNTYTDASNYERGSVSWVTSELQVKTQSSGTGTSRNIAISPAGGFVTIRDTSGIAKVQTSISAGTALITLWKTNDGIGNTETLQIGSQGAAFTIWSQKLGTGIGQPLSIGTFVDFPLYFVTNSATRWYLAGSASNYALAPYATDNLYDLGLTSSRVRTGYFGTGIAVGTTAPAYSFHALGGGMRAQALATPAAPTVTPTGVAGATAYTYYIVAKDRFGNKTLASVAGTTATGNAVLDVNNFNALSWAAVAGAASYDVLKADTGHSIAVGITTTTFNDVGAGSAVYTSPTRNATADLTADGIATIDGIAFRGTSWGPTFGLSIALGANATALGSAATAVGTGSSASSSASAFGVSASAASGSAVAIGSSASTTAGTGAIAIGASSQAIGGNASIALGMSTVSDQARTLVIGSAANTAFSIVDMYVGSGSLSATPQSFTLHASGGSGTDITGANLTLAGGQPTGAGVGGSILFSTASAGATGTALRALVTRAQFQQDGTLALFGGSRTNGAVGASLTMGYDASGGFLQSWGGVPLTLNPQGNGISLAAATTVNGTMTFGSGGPVLQFDNAGVLGIRNGATAQALRVYNTYTDAANYERGFVSWTGSEFHVGTEAAGTGSVRNLVLQSLGMYWRNTSGVNQFDVTGGPNSNGSVAIRPSGTAIYSVLTMQGTGQSTALGLAILAGQAQSWLSSDAFTFRKADGVTNYLTLGVSGAAFTVPVKAPSYTVAALPAAATAGTGARAAVTDSTVAATGNFGSVVAGGGANTVPVFCDGVNWIIA